MSPRFETEALRGTLDLLIFRSLSTGPMHGWGIGHRIQQMSGDRLEVNQGSMYPALQRLEKQGLIASEWGRTENNRRARFYRITASGRKALGEETASWRRFAATMDVVLQST